MHPRLPCSVLLSACAVVACSSSSGGGGGAVDPLDFTLQLRPLTPLNQRDLFDDVDSYTVTVDRGGAEIDVYELGTAGSDGTVTTPELAALDGAAVGIYCYDAGDELIAYGRSSAWTLPSEDDDDVPVLVGRVGAVGRLTDLPGALGLVGGHLVTDGAGGFLSIGGDERGLRGEDDGSSSLLRFDIGRPNTSLSFVRTGDLPDHDTVNGETVEGIAGHSVTRLTAPHQFQDWLLIAGGGGGLNGSSTVTDRMLLWDPISDEQVTLGSNGELPDGVYHHTATEFGAGFVAIIGGALGRTSTGALEDGQYAPRGQAAVFEPRSKSTETVLTGNENGNLLFHAAAALDGARVLTCGGIEWFAGGSEWEATSPCSVLDDSFVLERLDDSNHDLPRPLIHHTMTALPDGRVLLVGGFTTEGRVGGGGSVSPTSDIWAYSSDRGWEYVGALNVARGHHRTTVLPDGTVLVVGGTTEISSWAWRSDAPTGCIEIIDPTQLGNAQLVGDCDGSAFQADELSTPVVMPMVATDPDHGTLIVGGADSGRDAVGQVAWFVGGIVEP